MFIPKPQFSNRIVLLVCIHLFFFTSFSQVGIGTVTPDPSSMLDVSSTSQGILAPRMSTAQRLAIFEPANGLLVYDLDEFAFYFYEATSAAWVRLNSSQEKRDNFVLVKSEADFPPPVDGVINLQTNTYYEINGTIVLNNTINLNNAYLSGLDANEDRLMRTSGTIFSGSTGGSIRNVTLLGGVSAGSGGGTAFNITGATGQTLLVQSAIIANMASVGTLSGLGLYFTNIVQYSGNTTGITYNNIGSLLLSNQGWFGNNTGTFETLTGTFALVQKSSGFSEVNGSAVGIDVNLNPAVGKGIILGTVFTGSSTSYVIGYTTGSYPGYYFNNKWGIECPGLPLEIDAVATGNVFLRRNVTTDNPTIDITTANAIAGVTESANLFRMGTSAGGIDDNLLVYEGSKTRTFNFSASLSYELTTGSNTTIIAFYLRKFSSDGTEIPLGTEVYDQVDNSTVNPISLTGTVTLNPGDYVRVYAQRLSVFGRNDLRAYSMSFSID